MTRRIIQTHERVLAIDASRGGDPWTYAVARWVVESVELDESNIGLAPDGSRWCLGVASREYPLFDRVGRVSGRAVERQTMRGAWLPFTPPAGTRARPMLHVELVDEVPDGSDAEGSIKFLARVAAPKNWTGEPIRKVFADQYEFGALSALMKRAGFRPYEETWSASTKTRAVDRLDRLLRDSQIRLPPGHEKLRRQLSEYSEKITRTGTLTYGGTGKHDDLAQVLITLCMASVSRELPGDPFGIDRRRHEIGV
jgi:hypothetical protein